MKISGLPVDATLAASLPDKKADLHQTASEFESLLLGQLLKAARADSEGWFGTGEDQTSASLIDMAEEQVAKALSQAGGLGLARMVESQLASMPDPKTATVKPGSPAPRVPGIGL